MKLLTLILATSLFSLTGWQTDFEKAKQQASAEHKYILLNFSGSDWCAPCIRLEKGIFGSSAFQSYAEKNLVLVNADFPRAKKSQLSKEQQKANELLADKYNPEGKFPLTLIMDAEGKVVKVWEGYPGITAEAFVQEVQIATNDQHR